MNDGTMNQSDYLVSVTVNGSPTGVWDSMSGGEVTADVGKRYAGGSQTPEVKRARKVVGDLTISRGFNKTRDDDLLTTLLNVAGRADVTVTRQPLDVDGVPFGKPRIYNGRLSGVNLGDVAADSDDDSTLEITVVAGVLV